MALTPDVTGSAFELGALADAGALHGSLRLPGTDFAAYRRLLTSMILIRAAEEWIGDMVAKGVVKCPCHLAIGQEAPAVGVAEHMRRGDRLFGAHRSHAHFLALGGSVHSLMAEVQGKNTGASRGMGGSMHLIDTAHGLFGTVPIVGATIPIAVGAGLAAKLDNAGALAVSFFGDGATEEGGFHESMNLAAVLKVPVLFVCEHNFFSSHLHVNLRQPADSTCRYAEAHRVPWRRVDGNDVFAVSEAVAQLAEEARNGGGPRYLEAVTYRWRGHVGPREDEDVGVKRKDDLAVWKQRDPIRRLADALSERQQLDERALSSLFADARRRVAAAWEQANADPYPPLEALLDRVWADGRGPLS
jgi:pyruvate dehydrogenase E1 component alpha subunit